MKLALTVPTGGTPPFLAIVPTANDMVLYPQFQIGAQTLGVCPQAWPRESHHNHTKGVPLTLGMRNLVLTHRLSLAFNLQPVWSQR